jgi:hypothetical protein
VLGGLNRLLALAVVAGAVLSAPATALACGGGPSAQNVYTECVPTGGGGKPTTAGHSTRRASTLLPISKRVARALAKHGGNNRALLSQLVRNPGYGASSTSEFPSSSPASAPSALGSAFDLGSGPTALLAVLAGTAILLLAASGVRGLRHRRR